MVLNPIIFILFFGPIRLLRRSPLYIQTIGKFDIQIVLSLETQGIFIKNNLKSREFINPEILETQAIFIKNNLKS